MLQRNQLVLDYLRPFTFSVELKGGVFGLLAGLGFLEGLGFIPVAEKGRGEKQNTECRNRTVERWRAENGNVRAGN